MIQRIQSLLLLLAAICLILGALMPIGNVITNEAQYLYNSWFLKLNTPDGGIIKPTYYIGILQIVLAIICIVAIFMYKKRTTQSKLCVVGIFINFILLLLVLYIFPDRIFPAIFNGTINVVYNPWIITSILSLAMLYLANRSILKDEKKVRDAERLR